MQRTHKGGELTQQTHTVRPGTNIRFSYQTTIHLDPWPIQKARRSRKCSNVNINLNINLALLSPAPPPIPRQAGQGQYPQWWWWGREREEGRGDSVVV